MANLNADDITDDPRVAFIRDYLTTNGGYTNGFLGKALSAYDANRQRAGEELGSICSAHRPRQAGCPRCYPATVRVPREPTEAMLEAGDECSHYMVHCKKVWQAMLSAAESER